MKKAKLYYDKESNQVVIETDGIILAFDHAEIEGCDCETIIQNDFPKMYLSIRYKRIQHIIKGKYKTAVKFEV